MKNITKLLFILVLSATTGINSIAANNSGKEQQERKIKNFNGIAVSSGIELYLTAGDEESVRIEASDEVIEDVVTEVKDNTLHIYMKQKNWLNFFNWGRTGTVKAYVTSTELNSLKSSSGSKVRSNNTLKGDSFTLNVSSGGDVKLDLIYRDLRVDSSSGSQVRLSGRCKDLETDASSGSMIDAKGLESVSCEADASSGGNIKLMVTGELRAKASSGGNIHYAGNPGTKDFNSSSGGSVSAL